MTDFTTPLQDLEEHMSGETSAQEMAIQQSVAQRAETLASDEVESAPTDAERNRSHKLKNDNLETDIKLKKSYAKWLIGVMIGQLLIMNIVFIFVGLDFMKYNEYILHLYISGTLLELFGLVLVITKYLFKK